MDLSSNYCLYIITSSFTAVYLCWLVILYLCGQQFPSLSLSVLTIAFYHLGCFFEYLLGLHDGARVFPVHGVRYVNVNTCVLMQRQSTLTISSLLSLSPCSGFWGVLCVGIFGKSCFLQEVYNNLCYCLFSELPDVVRGAYTEYTTCAISHNPFPPIVTWTPFCLSIGGWSLHHCLVLHPVLPPFLHPLVLPC